MNIINYNGVEIDLDAAAAAQGGKTSVQKTIRPLTEVSTASKHSTWKDCTPALRFVRTLATAPRLASLVPRTWLR